MDITSGEHEKLIVRDGLDGGTSGYLFTRLISGCWIFADAGIDCLVGGTKLLTANNNKYVKVFKCFCQNNETVIRIFSCRKK